MLCQGHFAICFCSDSKIFIYILHFSQDSVLRELAYAKSKHQGFKVEIDRYLLFS